MATDMRPQQGQRLTEQIVPSLQELLLQITEYNDEEIRNFINEDVFGVGSMTTTEILRDTGSANDWMENIIRVLENNQLIRDTENLERRERGLRLKRDILKQDQKTEDIINQLRGKKEGRQ